MKNVNKNKTTMKGNITEKQQETSKTTTISTIKVSTNHVIVVVCGQWTNNETASSAIA